MSEKNKRLESMADAILVQKEQLESAQVHSGRIGSAVNDLQAMLSNNQAEIDVLTAKLELMMQSSSVVFDEDEIIISEELFISEHEPVLVHDTIQTLDFVDLNSTDDWQSYQAAFHAYAERNNVELGNNPFSRLMTDTQLVDFEKWINEEFTLKAANCDKYDYMIAATSGVIGGLIDILFVGAPGEGVLTKFTDDMANGAVEKFARFNGWKGPREGSDSVSSAIGFLEGKYKVNYDHRHGGDVNHGFKMSTKNHHIKSLGHSPDIVGLFFSILGQFSNQAFFVDGGKLISIDTENFELNGSNLVSKIFCGFANWLGHIFSDMAGSSGALGRGSGVPIPFFSLFQFLNVGEFGQHRQSFAKIAVQVFERGYDLRHGMAMAIPVMVTELLTRLMWVVKQRFYHERDWSECMPKGSVPELRRMLFVAHGSLCVVDGVDAGLRSGGEIILFLSRTNLIAWVRFGTCALKEFLAVCKDGSIDVDAIDEYLDDELERLIAA
ncbi:MAG: hypothetical protein Q8J78_03770 [Moraxellaceae bacterium]|nr:hypothetical protein [Moraxellaceae bacterium]